MGDEQIAAYLRSRGRATPPSEIVDDVIRTVAATPQRARPNWFAPFLPAAATVGAIAVLAVVASLLAGPQNVGPSPPPTRSVSPTLASAQPSPSPAGLVEVGASVDMPALDASGEYGTITLTRGEDVPLYAPLADIEGGGFIIELHVRYELERLPEPATWGWRDYLFEAELQGTELQGTLSIQPVEPDIAGLPQPSLATWPGATVPEVGVYEGWLAVAVPPAAADGRIRVRYEPEGRVSPGWYLVVREPAPPPEGATPPPPAGLIVGPERCINEDFAVDVPDGWYANQATEEAQSCTFFAPAEFDPTAERPNPGVAVVIELNDGGTFGFHETEVVSEQELTVLDQPALRYEIRAPVIGLRLWYIVGVDGELPVDEDGTRWLSASATAASEEAYLAHVDALEAMLGSLELLNVPRADYVDKPDLPFTVIDSQEADELFADPDTCTNPEAGYTVRYPDSWYTNTAIENVPACSWFSPVLYQVDDPSQVPEEIAIVIQSFEGAVGQIWVHLFHQEVAIDGVQGYRSEHGYTKEVDMPTDHYNYSYGAWLDDDPVGRKISAHTDTEMGGDYELNRAVFDRIMASLEFAD